MSNVSPFQQSNPQRVDASDVQDVDLAAWMGTSAPADWDYISFRAQQILEEFYGTAPTDLLAKIQRLPRKEIK